MELGSQVVLSALYETFLDHHHFIHVVHLISSAAEHTCVKQAQVYCSVREVSVSYMYVP